MFLGDFVEQLAAKLHQQKVTMPFEDERPWHELFYELKREADERKPAFFANLRFDWDGPYPKCFELSEFLHALHWNACVDARNPHFDTISLPEAIAEAWSKRSEQSDPRVKAFLERSAQKAREVFQPVAR
jgi:hypothetical protein